jgi:hypothetical protein
MNQIDDRFFDFLAPYQMSASKSLERLTTFFKGDTTMNQDKQETKTEQSPVEDLTIDEAQAGEVKGGAHVDYFLKLKGIDGEATNC